MSNKYSEEFGSSGMCPYKKGVLNLGVWIEGATVFHINFCLNNNC